MVFFGASACGACTMTGVRESVQGAIDSVREYARRRGAQFGAIGVSTDWSIEDGYAYLQKIERFDEIVVGRNWVNTAVVRYVWTDFPGKPALPQLLIYERGITIQDSSILVSKERVLARVVGASEITAFNSALLTQSDTGR